MAMLSFPEHSMENGQLDADLFHSAKVVGTICLFSAAPCCAHGAFSRDLFLPILVVVGRCAMYVGAEASETRLCW